MLVELFYAPMIAQMTINRFAEEKKLRKAAEDNFMDSLKGLSDEDRKNRIKERAANKERIERALTEERRHQELCSAIRSTKWSLF